MTSAEITAHDSLLIETIARHFPEAQIRGDEIALGLCGPPNRVPRPRHP